MSCNALSAPDFQAGVFRQPYEMGVYPTNKANLTLNNFATVFRFTLDVLRLQTTNTISSPYIELNGVNWLIRFNQLNNNINVSLVPSFNYGAGAVEVEAAFKLYQKQDKKDKSFVRLLSKRLVSSYKSVSTTIENFIDLKDFMENYVYENKATFEIEIITNPLSRKDLSPQLGLDVVSKKIFVEVENVNNLFQNISALTEVRGVDWKVLTEMKQGKFGVYLQADENHLGKWSYEVDATFKLLSFNSSVESIQNSFTHNFHLGSTTRGFENVLGWSDMIGNGFVVNNTANLFVDIKVGDPQPLWSF